MDLTEVFFFFVYLIPGNLANALYEYITSPSERKTTDIEKIGSWLIWATPILWINLYLLRLLEKAESLSDFPGLISTLQGMAIYAGVTVLSLLSVFIVRFLICPGFLWLINKARGHKGDSGLQSYESVWSCLFTDGKNAIVTELVLPDGTIVHGELGLATMADRCRELYLENLKVVRGSSNQAPEKVYINIETGQVLPIWHDWPK